MLNTSKKTPTKIVGVFRQAATSVQTKPAKPKLKPGTLEWVRVLNS